MSQIEDKNFSLFRIFLVILYLIAFILIGYFLYDGMDYYIASLQDRPRHPNYRFLKPGGTRATDSVFLVQ